MQLVDVRVVHLIAQLRAQGVVVCLATDNMDTFRRWTVPALRLREHFDHIIDSSYRGILKAQRGYRDSSPFFDPFLHWHGANPAEGLLIDDSRSMEAVAKEIGLRFRRVCAQVSLVDVLNDVLREVEEREGRDVYYGKGI